MKKIIVFGGSGFLGSHVADTLANHGYEVTIFDINESLHLKSNQRFIKGDITDKTQIEQAIIGQDAVYNFAGIADIDEASENPVKTITTNIIGNTNILEVCRINEIKRYVFASTIYVYSNSGSFYRTSKQACELIIEEYNRKYGLNFTILRYGSLYGPRANGKNSMYNFVKQAMENGKIIRHGDGNELRDYIHVYDASQLSVRILDEEFRNQHVILSGQQKIKIKDLLLMIKEMLNNKVELEFREQGQSSHHYNITPFEFAPKLAKKITGYTHIDLGQGILDLMNTLYKEKQLKQDESFNNW
ncbi:MAG: NAD(P)-dependent oxidoreductase [Parcubacteria group bacterium]